MYLKQSISNVFSKKMFCLLVTYFINKLFVETYRLKCIVTTLIYEFEIRSDYFPYYLYTQLNNLVGISRFFISCIISNRSIQLLIGQMS